MIFKLSTNEGYPISINNTNWLFMHFLPNMVMIRHRYFKTVGPYNLIIKDGYPVIKDME